jgi:TniQ
VPNAWCDSGLSGRRWPLHSKLYDDELLSSWLVRLSRAYGMEVGRFCASVWRHAAFWSRDIEGIYPEVLEVLIDKTATPLARVFNTTLWGYHGFPAWELDGSGVSPWLLSIGLQGGRRHRSWLQYCPYCLHNDPDPYFRRRGRLTFVTVCPRHRCRLLDRCVACGAPCNIDQVSSDAEAITHCYRCQFDARRAQAPTLDNTAGRHCLMQLQTLLIEGLHREQYPLSRTVSVSMEEFLPVLRHLGRLLSTRKRSGELRSGLCGEMGEPYFEPSFPSSQGRALEVLSVMDRFRLMLLLAWWLDDWPDQFVAICAMAKLTVTDLRSNFSNRPDWYEEAVGQVASGRFAGMKFHSFGTTSSVASASDQMRQAL